MPTKLPIVEAPATVVPPEPDTPQHAARKATSEERLADETALLTGGQRRINLIWEVTQGMIAVMLVGSSAIATVLGLSLPTEFWVLVGIVITAYFQRTNHTRVGGVKSEAER